MIQATAEQLLLRFYDGDEAAFEQLARETARYRFQVAYYALPAILPGRWQAAEDIAQRALYQVWRTRERSHTRWRPRRGVGLRGWMGTAVRNLAFSHARKKGWLLERSQDWNAWEEMYLPTEDGTQEAVDLEDQRQQLEQALPLLDADQRQLIEWRREGVKLVAIGKRLGVSKPTAMRRVHAAIQAVQELVH